MPEKTHNIVAPDYFLEPGYILVSAQPVVISTVLGSSVAVSMADRKRKISGMNHFQFPIIRKKEQATARYGNVAIPHLIRMMLAEGTDIDHLEAQIFGGAYEEAISPKDIGCQNIELARTILDGEGIRVVSEDVGGVKGRKIVFNLATNEIAVLKVNHIRKGDWYPYAGGDR